MNAWLTTLSLIAGLALASRPSDGAELALPDLSGAQQRLEQYRGQVVVLNFWATWCVPCREEMPLLVDIQNRYTSRDVVVVGASADDESTRMRIRPFVEELRITFPIWTGATSADMDRLGLGTALPATAIIDRDGRIAFRIIGVLERKDLVRRLDYLLSAKRGKAPEPVIDMLSGATDAHEGHEQGEEDEHAHGGVSMEGASLVPS